MDSGHEARLPGYFAPWQPRSSSRAPADVRVRAATAADLVSVAGIAAARYAVRPPDSARAATPEAEDHGEDGRASAELGRFERTLRPVDDLLPGVPRLWVAEASLESARPEVLAFGTLFVFTNELRARAGRELGLDLQRRGDGQLAPAGWYLGGLVVASTARRRGLGHDLTAARLAALDTAGVADVRFCANVQNRATLALHATFGFELEARNPRMSGLAFSGGEGLLLVRRVELRA